MKIVNTNVRQSYPPPPHTNSVEHSHSAVSNGVVGKSGPIDKVDISSTEKSEKNKVIGQFDKVDLTVGFTPEQLSKLLSTEIGKQVEAMFEEAGIEPLEIAGLDFSPEATADRVFKGTSGLFEIWKRQHPEMTEAELIDSFEEVVRQSIDQGAEEAMLILKGQSWGDGVMNNLESTASDTIDLVHKKYDTFFESLRGNLSEDESDVAHKSEQ